MKQKSKVRVLILTPLFTTELLGFTILIDETRWFLILWMRFFVTYVFRFSQENSEVPLTVSREALERGSVAATLSWGGG